MIRHALCLLGLAGTIALGAACSASPNGAIPFDSATLAERTTVIEGDLAEQAQVYPDRLVFPSSAWGKLGGKRAGDILVGDRAESSTGNPSGFLRKVVSVSNDGMDVTVLTEPATLDEAVESLQFSAKIQTPALGLNGPITQGAGSLGIQGGGKPIQVLDFSGKQILDWTGEVEVDPGQKVGFNAFAKVNTGTVNFTPEWDVGADVGFLKVKSFRLVGTGTLDAQLEVYAGVKLTTTLDAQSFTKLVAKKIFKSQSTTIAEYKYNAGKLKVGPLPIPLTGHFVATLQCDFTWGGGAEVTIGGAAKASVTAGMKYENGQMSPVFAKSAELTQTGPAWTLDGATRIMCAIRPEFGLNLYDVASGRVWAEGYVDVGGKLACGGKNGAGEQTAIVSGQGAAGVTAGVQAKVDVFGLKKWEKDCILFSVDKSAEFSRTFTLPGGPNATCTPDDQGFARQPPAPAPELCFGGGGSSSNPPPPPSADGGGGGIPGTCTHGVCQVGEKLGSACDACTAKVCAKDPYCCTTYWGPSCFVAVESECGMKCQ
jgi:hypothetical protein